jgi:F-type H+-transporting ATPase subunit b
MRRKFRSVIGIFILAFSSLLLSSCDTSSLEETFSEIEAKLIPNIRSFLAQILATLFLIFLFIRFGYKPIRKLIDKRKAILDNEVKDTKEARDSALHDAQEAQKTISESKLEAEKIIEEAEKEARKKGDIIVDDAVREARAKVEEATRKIAEEREKSLDSIKDEIVQVAIEASKQILGREFSDKDSAKLVDKFVSEIHANKDGGKDAQ